MQSVDISTATRSILNNNIVQLTYKIMMITDYHDIKFY